MSNTKDEIEKIREEREELERAVQLLICDTQFLRAELKKYKDEAQKENVAADSYMHIGEILRPHMYRQETPEDEEHFLPMSVVESVEILLEIAMKYKDKEPLK